MLNSDGLRDLQEQDQLQPVHPLSAGLVTLHLGPGVVSGPAQGLSDAAAAGTSDGYGVADADAVRSPADASAVAGSSRYATQGTSPRTRNRWLGGFSIALLLGGFMVFSASSEDANAGGGSANAGVGAEDVAGVDQWPDGTRVDFKEGAKKQFSHWHMDEALANWYPNQGSICEMVTVDGPLTLVKDIADGYERTARAFGDDAYSIGWATAVLAVDHCPNAWAYVADKPRTDARAHYEAARKAASEKAEAEAAVRERQERDSSEAAAAEQARLRRAQLAYWPARAQEITWDSAVCEDYRDSGRYSDSGGDASAEVTRFHDKFKDVEDFNWTGAWDEARSMLHAKCDETSAPGLSPIEDAEDAAATDSGDATSPTDSGDATTDPEAEVLEQAG